MKSETIIQAEYVVRIVTPKNTPETNLRLGRQFTPTVDKAISAAIHQAAKKALRRHIVSSRLDKCFRLER
jgi:hypothetical protein